MVAKPLALLVQRNHEQLLALQAQQHIQAVTSPGQGVTQFGAELVKHRSLVEKQLQLSRQAVDDILGQYLRGQLLVMLTMACYYSVGLALFGFQLALPVGVFTGVAMCIPYLGFGVGLFLALFAGVLQFTGWYGLIAVAVVYGLGQVLESFFLTPRLVGERIGMHPLMVIFALLAFGHLFGFVGVLVALPVSAVLVVAVRRLKAAYLASKLYAGLDS